MSSNQHEENRPRAAGTAPVDQARSWIDRRTYGFSEARGNCCPQHQASSSSERDGTSEPRCRPEAAADSNLRAPASRQPRAAFLVARVPACQREHFMSVPVPIRRATSLFRRTLFLP